MMFPKPFKIGSYRNKEWRCCFCMHVRTATVLFGLWHLLLHVMALAVLAMLMRNHKAVMQRNEDFEQNNFLPTPLSKIKDEENPYYLPTTQDGHTIYSSDIDMGALMTVCTLTITMLMVYGAVRGKATHLLPFFCLQLFDFAITTLTATGYFCYLRSVHRLVAEHWHNLPFRNEILKLKPQYLSLLVLAVFLVSMMWKAYWIGVVWRCYKYLTLKQQTQRNTIHYILPGEGSDRIPEPDYSTLLRDQEGAFGGGGCGGVGLLKQTPPPSYADIMDDQPPPYRAAFINELNPSRFQLVVQDRPSSPDSVVAVAAGTSTDDVGVANATTAPASADDDEQPEVSAVVRAGTTVVVIVNNTPASVEEQAKDEEGAAAAAAAVHK